MGFFSSPPRPDRLLGPPNLLSDEHRTLLPAGVKPPAREADHSPLSKTEVKNLWSCTSIPSVHLHGVFDKQRDSLTFIFTFSKTNNRLRKFVASVML
jgi:hypothetical protein